MCVVLQKRGQSIQVKTNYNQTPNPRTKHDLFGDFTQFMCNFSPMHFPQISLPRILEEHEESGQVDREFILEGIETMACLQRWSQSMKTFQVDLGIR